MYYKLLMFVFFAGFLPVKVLERKPGEPWSVPFLTALSACRAEITALGWQNWFSPAVLLTVQIAKNKVLVVYSVLNSSRVNIHH